ncbi:DNA polymerase III subunit delta [Thermicanus aegyptius]|uniref:DNA polymerase III subunit delta n=1 Tax=Thermicanus aegyptius TaxID=94009 RepID=UPI00146FBF7F|nr:DNA polymerase III subunit delta [Thermicanus aegyptius]
MEQWIEEVRRKEYSPVYLLYGEEEYQIEVLLKELIHLMVDPVWREMDFLSFDMTKTPIQTAIGEAETFPFGSERKIVLLKNAYFLTGSTFRTGVEHDLDTLKDYLENPSTFTSLILVAPYAKLDERKKVVKELLKKSKIYHAKPFTEEEREKWLRKQIKERKILMGEEELEVLSYLLPKSLPLANQELEKISLYSIGRKEPITREELEALITHTVEGDVFSLIDKALHQDLEGAFFLYRELMKRNEEPIKVLHLFGRQIRLLIQVKTLTKDGLSQKEIASRLRIHPYPVKLALNVGRDFPLENLFDMFHMIADYDRMMKEGKMEKRLALEIVILKLQAIRKKTTA